MHLSLLEDDFNINIMREEVSHGIHNLRRRCIEVDDPEPIKYILSPEYSFY